MQKTTVNYCDRDVSIAFKYDDYIPANKSSIDYTLLHKLGTSLIIVEDTKGTGNRSITQHDLPIKLAIKVKSSIYRKYVVDLTINEISAGLSISLISFIRFIADQICKKYLHETSIIIDGWSWQIMVINMSNERRSNYSALFTTSRGRVASRFDELTNSKVRSIAFVDSTTTDNIIIAYAVRIPDGYIGWGMLPIQKLYEEAIAALKGPERYGIYNYKPVENNNIVRPTDKLTPLTTMQANKKHVIGFEYEIIHSSKQKPVIKFNKKIDLSTLTFKFVGERGVVVNVITNDLVMDPSNYLVYYRDGAMVVDFVIQHRYDNVSFYTYDRVINTDLINITLK